MSNIFVKGLSNVLILLKSCIVTGLKIGSEKNNKILLHKIYIGLNDYNRKVLNNFFCCMYNKFTNYVFFFLGKLLEIFFPTSNLDVNYNFCKLIRIFSGSFHYSYKTKYLF